MRSEVTVRYEDGREQKFPNLQCGAVYELADDTLRYVRPSTTDVELARLVITAQHALAFLKAQQQRRFERGEKQGGGSEDFVWLELEEALKPFGGAQ